MAARAFSCPQIPGNPTAYVGVVIKHAEEPKEARVRVGSRLC